jgi:hypothetical protein
MSPLSARHLLVVALLAAVSLSSCGGDDRDGAEGDNRPDARPPSPTLPARARGATTSASTSVRISFGDTELTGQLLDNATARVAAQLPLTLTFRDHNNVETTAPLSRKLSLNGTPAGHDPVAGDIGYWTPDANLVLYYDDQAPYWNGIVRIGEFDGDMTSVRGLPEGTRERIEAAD